MMTHRAGARPSRIDFEPGRRIWGWGSTSQWQWGQGEQLWAWPHGSLLRRRSSSRGGLRLLVKSKVLWPNRAADTDRCGGRGDRDRALMALFSADILQRSLGQLG